MSKGDDEEKQSQSIPSYESSSPQPHAADNHVKFRPEKRKALSETGYARLAWLMANRDTRDLAIFRKFGELNMLNLLSLQAELMSLQAEYKSLYNKSENQKNAFSFTENGLLQDDDGNMYGDKNYEASDQHLCMLKIRDRLNIYNKTLWKVSQLESLERPDDRSLQCLQLWLIRYKKKVAGQHIKIGLHGQQEADFLPGAEHFTWNGTEGLEDFVVVRAPKPQDDSFSEKLTPKIAAFLFFCQDTVPLWFQEMRSKLRRRGKPQDETQDRTQDRTHVQAKNQTPTQDKTHDKTQDKKQDKKQTKSTDKDLLIHSWARTAGNVSAFIISLLAALFPVAAMVGLFFIKDTLKRIYTLLGLTVAFAFAVKFCTSAKSSELFAVAAAFVAVEVVFVGSPPAAPTHSAA